MSVKPARRSSLILPINVSKFVERAHLRDADAIVLDLEDSVPPAEKASARKLIPEAIRQVAARKLFLEPALAREIAVERVSNPGNPLEALTAREFEVFLMLARGKSVADIAEVLFLSPRTVGTHLYNIKQKLGAGNAAELTLIAIRNGLIEA